MIGVGDPPALIARAAPAAFISGFQITAERIDGPCTFKEEYAMIRAYASSPGTCRARVVAINEQQSERTVKELVIEAAARGADGTLPQGSIRATQEGLSPGGERHNPLPTFSLQVLEHSAPNAFSLTFRNGTGVRHRAGKFVINPDAVYGNPAQREIDEINKLLSATKRFVVLRTGPAPEAQLDDQRIDEELSQGMRGHDYNLSYRVYVDLASPDQLAALMNAIAATGVVEYMRPEGTVGSMEPNKPAPKGKPLPWPTAADIQASERGQGVGTPYGQKLPPGGRPVPTRRRPMAP
jgi:hypothetical protein